MIEVKDLVKRYGDHLAVNGLSFTVEKGQIYGFLGPNGAGKSTTMNIITGYIASTGGSVSINGHDILEEPEEAKKCIGYLPEQPPLYFDMTVWEYLRFVADLKKIPKGSRLEMMSEVMEMTKITDMKNRLIKNLSKGYRQRVGLAQAIMGYPEVIILDEPTVGLDPKQIIEIRELIKGLSKKHTVILSSHILSEVSAVCDYVMIIAHGQLVASDTPENLSKLMQGNETLNLRVKGTKEQAEAVLNMTPDLEEWSFCDSDEEDTIDIEVKAKEDADVRESIFYAMAEAKCPILMMRATKVSLEDVFLELTAEDAKNHAAISLSEGDSGEDIMDGEIVSDDESMMGEEIYRKVCEEENNTVEKVERLVTPSKTEEQAENRTKDQEENGTEENRTEEGNEQ